MVARYEPNFISIVPALRSRDLILADLQVAGNATTTEVAKAKVAEIELHVKNGSDAYLVGNYSLALAEFKQARAKIYKALHPNFDADSFVNSRVDMLLPAGAAIEKSLLTMSLRIADHIRPKAPDPAPLWQIGAEIPEDLRPFTATGFRESVTVEESLQWAIEQSIGLLTDRKPAAAAGILTEAIQIAQRNDKVDPAIVAAGQLNLSAALLEMNDVRQAQKFADGALQTFRQKNDSVGIAQALHMSAVVAHRQGNARESQRLLGEAAETLKKAGNGEAGAPAGPIAGPAGLVRPLADNAPLGETAGVHVAAGRSVIMRSPETARLHISSSRDLADLKPIANRDAQRYTYRIPGRVDGWGSIDFTDDRERKQQDKAWTVGIPVGNQLATLSFASGATPTADQLVAGVYKQRTTAELFSQLDFKVVDTSTTTFYLTHLYAYVLPVKMGDCYRNLGQYKNAEKYYITASQYSFLNKTIEATSLWIRMTRNLLAWGDSLYKSEDLPAAKAQYAKIVTDAGQVPASYLYNTASLKVPADQGRSIIQNILVRPLPQANWEITMNVLTALERLQQIGDGLDFYGLALSPIHTFEYLQSVARAFAQEAMQAESEFINFKSRQEMEEANRRDLETAKAMADAEVEGRFQLWQSAIDDKEAAQKGVALATKRRDDAQAQRNAYAATSNDQIWGQAAAAALGGGEDAYWSEISELADRLARGETISGPGPKLAAAQILYSGRRTREYELKKMDDNIAELTAAIGVAQEQVQSAQRRAAAAELAWEAAKQRADMAKASLDAFDNEFFTPESWQAMADVMRDIAGSFLWRAIRIAKLMERAYNFDNDSQFKIIKNEYGFAVANAGTGQDAKLLGGNRLLLDVESFTYSAITTTTRKNSRIKDVISIAADFPAQFQQFRTTGLLSIETDLVEFDRLHPGFYGQRIEAVEIQIIGLLPEGDSGLNGTVAAGGVTSFRRKNGTTGKRVHQIDTMALSDFILRNDVFLYSAETGVRGLFQGLGLGSTWQLHLPKRSNDLDFRRIFDVQFVFYYTAKYDAVLRTNVLAKPPRPGEQSLLRDFALRYDFPDAWYAFYKNGKAEFTLDRARLPMNQQNFKVQAAHFRVVTKQGVAANNIKVKITGPNNASGTVTTNANGVVSTSNAAIAGIVNANPVSKWKVEVVEGPSLLDGNVMKFDRVYNIQFGLDYSFDFVPEAV